jgi:hypothetical protein
MRYCFHLMCYCCCLLQAKKGGEGTKLVIKLAEHSGTGVVVEGGVESPANTVKDMVQVISAGNISITHVPHASTAEGALAS